jgi:hypothetical protein
MRYAAFGGLAYEKPQSAYGLCAVFLRHIFLRPETAARFLYRAQKNVAYNRNVMRNTTLKFFKKLCQAASPLVDKIKNM